jgi:hypothetical protein
MKLILVVVAVAVFGLLFIRSVRNTGAAPYTMRRADLSGWTLALAPDAAASGVLLGLWPPNGMARPLFSQLFSRSGLSLSGPNPVAMPLVLKGEYDRALSPAVTPEALLAMARESGLESVQPKPVCMATRRVSEPGLTRELFFVRFDHAPFASFRRQVAAQAGDRAFDAGSLSPVVIVAATDAAFASWLPLDGDGPADCLAPLNLE